MQFESLNHVSWIRPIFCITCKEKPAAEVTRGEVVIQRLTLRRLWVLNHTNLLKPTPAQPNHKSHQEAKNQLWRSWREPELRDGRSCSQENHSLDDSAAISDPVWTAKGVLEDQQMWEMILWSDEIKMELFGLNTNSYILWKPDILRTSSSLWSMMVVAPCSALMLLCWMFKVWDIFRTESWLSLSLSCFGHSLGFMTLWVSIWTLTCSGFLQEQMYSYWDHVTL